MKTLRLFFRNIPRKTKILLNILLVFLLAFWSYLLLGSPADIETLYRRAEKANLVGPGNILAVVDAPEQGYTHIVLAEDGNHVMAYFRDPEDARRTRFVYRERSRGMVLLSLPADNTTAPLTAPLPVFLFDGYDSAFRAELSLSLPDGSSAIGPLCARRENPGCFRFALDARELSPAHGQLVSRLRLLSGNTMAAPDSLTLCARVRLYDEKDALLTEISLTLGG